MTGPEDPDAVLLDRFAAGDRAAARALTVSLTPRVFSLASRLLGDQAEAEDVTQEAMLRLWRMAPDWEPGKARVSTWLYRVVLNLCHDRHRRRQRTGASLEDLPEPADDAPAMDERLQDTARMAALQSALLDLPARQRQAVVLRHFEDLANPRIAEIMQISVEAVESLTARGKRALAGALANQREELGYDQ